MSATGRRRLSLIDDLEDALEWPKLVEKATKSRKDAEKWVDKFGNDEDKRLLSTLQRNFQNAVELENWDMLRRTMEEFDALWSKCAFGSTAAAVAVDSDARHASGAWVIQQAVEDLEHLAGTRVVHPTFGEYGAYPISVRFRE